MTETTATPALEKATSELEEAFPGAVSWTPDGDGGVDVTIAALDLGSGWKPQEVDLTFNLAYNYPFTPVYPYYLPAGTEPPGAWPQALQHVTWKERAVIQVSLRIGSWDPNRDTAVGCVWATRRWLSGLS